MGLKPSTTYKPRWSDTSLPTCRAGEARAYLQGLLPKVQGDPSLKGWRDNYSTMLKKYADSEPIDPETFKNLRKDFP